MIYFRIWHKKLNKFLTADEWILGLDGKIYFIYIDPMELVEVAFDNVEVQRNTGLKSKSGQYIFEGDIINTKKNRYEVVYSPELALFEAIPIFYTDESNKYLSVIGKNSIIIGHKYA